MNEDQVKFKEFVDGDELTLLTDLLILWCEKNNRNPEELIPKCGIILQRYREGECEADKLFSGL